MAQAILPIATLALTAAGTGYQAHEAREQRIESKDMAKEQLKQQRKLEDERKAREQQQLQTMASISAARNRSLATRAYGREGISTSQLGAPGPAPTIKTTLGS